MTRVKPDETARERLARLRAEWVYKRSLGHTDYRDAMTVTQRAVWNARVLPRVQRAKLWLLPKPATWPANVVRLPRVRR